MSEDLRQYLICTTAAYFVCGIILIGSGTKENRAKISGWEIDQGG